MLITPGRQYALRSKDAICLDKKLFDVEPVQSLCNGDQVNRSGFYSGVFRARDMKFDSRVIRRSRNLRSTRVGRDDLIEIPADTQGCLAVAGCAVPRESVCGAGVAKKLKQLVRIARSILRVTPGVPGKMILELFQRTGSL
jgi:hypothetical protein